MDENRRDDLIPEETVFTWDNLLAVSTYMPTLINSIWLALIATFICLLLGYPVAYIISRIKASKQKMMIFLMILPMWINFLLRTYAWMTILENNGLLNKFLGLFGLGPFQFINTQGAVVLGMVYNYLPFMILPLYSVMVKIDDRTIEAARDLGAGSPNIFRRVVLPLSVPGIVSGVSMVFVPAVSTFIISKMLGGGNYVLIGNLIEIYFQQTGDWNFGSAISLIMALIIITAMWATKKLDRSAQED